MFESFKITLFGPLWTGWNKKICSRNYNFWNTSNTSLGNLGFKVIQGRLLIEDLRYIKPNIIDDLIVDVVCKIEHSTETHV